MNDQVAMTSLPVLQEIPSTVGTRIRKLGSYVPQLSLQALALCTTCRPTCCTVSPAAWTSQANAAYFLCSSQLYSKWQLRIPDQRHYQFVPRAVNWLEWAVDEGLCEAACSHITLRFNGEPDWIVTCRLEGQRAQFCLSRVVVVSEGSNFPSTDTPAWNDITKDQLWHRLTGLSCFFFCYF